MNQQEKNRLYDMAEESGLSNLSMLTRVVYDYEVERDGLITVKIGRRADFTQPVVWTWHEGLGEDDAIDKAAAAMLCNGVKPTLAVKTATEHLRVITDHHNENNLFCGGCGLAVEVLADVEEWLCPDCCSEEQIQHAEIQLWTLRDVKGEIPDIDGRPQWGWDIREGGKILVSAGFVGMAGTVLMYGSYHPTREGAESLAKHQAQVMGIPTENIRVTVSQQS